MENLEKEKNDINMFYIFVLNPYFCYAISVFPSVTGFSAFFTFWIRIQKASHNADPDQNLNWLPLIPYLLSYSSRGSLSTALRIRPSVNQQDSVDSRLLVLKKNRKAKKK